MSNPGYCPDCKQSGWACRCGREPITRAQPAPADVVERVALALGRWRVGPRREPATPEFIYTCWPKEQLIAEAKAALSAMGVSDEVERLRGLMQKIKRAAERDDLSQHGKLAVIAEFARQALTLSGGGS